jgi:hypothetical protein
MASDLTVPEGSTVVLDENPPSQLAAALQHVQITTLNELAEFGIIASKDTVDALLNAAKQATTVALTQRPALSPFVPVVGTKRPDLRRFGTFISGAGGINPNEAEIFWRVARDIDPHRIGSLSPDTKLHSTLPDALAKFTRFEFRDVVVEANATLSLAPTIHQLVCGELLIKKNGRMVVQGSGVKISAQSLRGEQ